MDEQGQELIRGKVDQAAAVLGDAGLDCWLVFCRETSEIPEPALPLVAGTDVVWETALLLTPSGDHHAVVGRYDAPPIEKLGIYEVHTYDESIEAPLRGVLADVDPGRIGLNYSTEEADIADYLHGRMREEGLDSAWGWDHCPAVDAGTDAPVGHSPPGNRRLPAGEVLHVDFGVQYRGYAADIQRLYYRSDGGDGPPGALREAFDDVRATIETAKAALEPDVQGYTVDGAARQEISDRGWPEFEHAVGHTVGRNAHDAGTLLGPRWERYGSRPEGRVEAVHTLELGVETEWGYLGLEELLEVTDDGARYFHEPQTELRVLPG